MWTVPSRSRSSRRSTATRRGKTVSYTHLDVYKRQELADLFADDSGSEARDDDFDLTAALEKASFVAVSYTHLDVYKRQVPDIRIAPAGSGAGNYLRLIYDLCHNGCLLYTSDLCAHNKERTAVHARNGVIDDNNFLPCIAVGAFSPKYKLLEI